MEKGERAHEAMQNLSGKRILQEGRRLGSKYSIMESLGYLILLLSLPMILANFSITCFSLIVNPLL